MDLSECQSLQREEWEVLESIYPECISSDMYDSSVKLEIPVEFSESRTVSIFNDGLSQSLSLAVLPPLLLHIILPLAYPLHDPPQLVSIHATHLWMPRLSKLQSALSRMWQPGETILYSWIEFIRGGEFLDSVDLISDTDPTVINIPHPAPQLLSSLLVAYEMSSNLPNSHKTRSKCLQLTCSHVFCRPCLEDFWQMCVREGEVSKVGCPDPRCVKSGREANEEEVARILTPEEIQRWRWLREKCVLEKDPTIMHCPMTFCQSPVPKQATNDEESGWDRLRICPSCSYSFCSFCKHAWHGPLSPCMASASSEIVKEYLALPEDSPERALLLSRYGRVNVLKLVNAYHEEQLNQQWLESSTMACPGCEVHMTCAKCRMHFCYRCGEKLNGSNPYVHFSTPGARCYNKLFDFNSTDDEEWIHDLDGL
ncbi:RWD-domain-containing protein [Desarmillaria ectypa]|nr:RWD-domain-containing protein [Desarmillaria ectypa]